MNRPGLAGGLSGSCHATIGTNLERDILAVTAAARACRREAGKGS